MYPCAAAAASFRDSDKRRLSVSLRESVRGHSGTLAQMSGLRPDQLVRVPGDELRDSEGERDLDGDEECEPDENQHNGVPRHSLFGLALGREPGLLSPLFGPLEQAVDGSTWRRS